MDESSKCPLCGRELPEKPSKHHLIPRSLKGRETVLLHRVCHRQIHATFTERELHNYYNTIERILENENIRKFVDWVYTTAQIPNRIVVDIALTQRGRKQPLQAPRNRGAP